jgi:hypothetical protein
LEIKKEKKTADSLTPEQIAELEEGEAIDDMWGVEIVIEDETDEVRENDTGEVNEVEIVIESEKDSSGKSDSVLFGDYDSSSSGDSSSSDNSTESEEDDGFADSFWNYFNPPYI